MGIDQLFCIMQAWNTEPVSIYDKGYNSWPSWSAVVVDCIKCYEILRNHADSHGNISKI